MIRLALIFAALPAVAAAQPAASSQEIAPVRVDESHATRAVDCRGADLVVVGSGDTLSVERCNTITLLGDANRVQARLLEGSSISAPGNRNVVSFEPAPGWSPRVSSTGLGNRITPEFSARDAAPRPRVLPGKG